MKTIEQTDVNKEWLIEVEGIVCKAVIFGLTYTGNMPVREKLWVKSLNSNGELVLMTRCGERIDGYVDDVCTAIRTGHARFSKVDRASKSTNEQ